MVHGMRGVMTFITNGIVECDVYIMYENVMFANVFLSRKINP